MHEFAPASLLHTPCCLSSIGICKSCFNQYRMGQYNDVISITVQIVIDQNFDVTNACLMRIPHPRCQVDFIYFSLSDTLSSMSFILPLFSPSHPRFLQSPNPCIFCHLISLAKPFFYPSLVNIHSSSLFGCQFNHGAAPVTSTGRF